MANATALRDAFDQYASNDRTNLSQLIESTLLELMTYPERAFLEVQTICNGGTSDKPTSFVVRYDPQQRAWQVGSQTGGEARAFQLRSVEFVRSAVAQMIRQNFCRVTVQTHHYVYHYNSTDLNLFK